MNTKIQNLIKKLALVAGAAATLSSAQASSDYGPAVWRPAPAGRWYTTGVGKQMYVEHDMEGYYLSTISYLQGGNTSVSVHYCVNGKTDNGTDAAPGEVSQMVADVYYAWHAVCLNTHSMSTEHEGFASNPAWYTPEMYQASADLTRSKADKYGFAKDRNHIVGHGEWQNSAWVNWVIANLGFDPRCNSHTDPGPYWDWAGFMNRINASAGNSGGPAACSNGSGLVDVFYRGTDNHLWNRYYNAGWSGENNLGEVLTSAPDVVAHDGKMEVFFRGQDGAVWNKIWNGTWGNAYKLQAVMVGGPSACSHGSGLVDVFYRGTDNHLWNRYFNTAWSGENNLGETLTSDPDAVAHDGKMEVFFRGGDGAVWDKIWDGTWANAYRLQAVVVGGPSACSRVTGTVDVFYRGQDNHLWNRYFNANGWSAENNLGEVLTSDPDAVAHDGKMEVFFRGQDGAVWVKIWNGGWTNAYKVGGTVQ
jgi:hypothetical protein